MIDQNSIDSGDFSIEMGQMADRLNAVAETFMFRGVNVPPPTGEALNGFGLIVRDVAEGLDAIRERLYEAGQSGEAPA